MSAFPGRPGPAGPGGADPDAHFGADGGAGHLRLPASVVAALWLPHLTDGPAGPSTARAALAAAALGAQLDRPVEQVLDGAADPAALPGLLADLAPVAEVAAVLPRPGDPMGLPAAVALPAAEPGADPSVQPEALLLRHGPAGERCLALVPELSVYGSVLEPGHMLTWRATPVPLASPHLLLSGVEPLSQARRDVRRALSAAVEALEALDVARSAPHLTDALNDAVLAQPHPAALPPGLDGRRLEVLTSAARLTAIVDLALGFEGAAVTAAQVAARERALRPVADAARRALCAASATRVEH